jgi:hypothetical protein
MTDPNDKKPEEGPVTGRQTIREVMAAVREAQQEEMRAEVLADRKHRRQAKEKRIRERRERQTKQAKATKQRRQGALTEARGKVANHVAVASRELRAALRDATSVPLPRHSQEGREQLRVRRSIEGALSALRQIGRGTFHVPDVDLDLDDVGT